MTITICGSVAFIDQMKQLAESLQALGDKVFMPTLSASDTSPQVTQPQKTAHMRKHIEYIRQSDAVLVANYDKNDIRNYIGANTFLEMGVAFALNKPIYLVNSVPEVAFSEEISGLEPIILHDNLDGIRRI